MATEAGTARPGSVAMETTLELELRSPDKSPAQNPAEPLCKAGATVTAARWDLRKYSLLIVIGDIGTESQLRAVRAHLEQGEPLSWLSRSTLSMPLCHPHSPPSAHFCILHLYVHFPRPPPLLPASSMHVSPELPKSCLPTLPIHPMLSRSRQEQKELRADPGVPQVTPLSRSVSTRYLKVLTRP